MPEPVVNLDREVWASLPGYPGYWVSSEGRVRSRRGVLKPSRRNRTGHLAVVLPGARSVLVHRLVALAFVPNPDALPLVLHGDDDPANNRAANLAWGTSAQNGRDAWANGRHPGRRKARVHGTVSMYNGGCRCGDCRSANATYHRARYDADPAWAEKRRADQRRYYHDRKQRNA